MKTKNQSHKCNHDLFKEESEKAFYLAGFIAADGCIRISKTNKKINYINHRLVIKLSIKDELHLELIRNLFDSDHQFCYETAFLSKTNSNWKDSKTVKISITSKSIVKDLEKFNIFPKKSLNYKFPEWLINHPLKHHFMRGYFDGDGTIHYRSNSSNIDWGLRGTIEFLEIYKTILNQECGLKTKSTPSMQNGAGNFRIHSNVMALKIRDFLYKDASIFMNRKHNIFWSL